MVRIGVLFDYPSAMLPQTVGSRQFTGVFEALEHPDPQYEVILEPAAA